MVETDIKRIQANGIDFAYLEKGEGPLVLCLHGFPDTAHGFEETLSALAAAGFRAVAPFMRGYYPSGLSAEGDYSVLSLGKDVLALIDAFEADTAIVIGHDWGAFAAYTAANLQPEKISRLVLMCVPHMHNTRMSWAQLKKSWYVFFFQLPWWPERTLPKNNYEFIDNLYRAWSPGWDPDQFKLEPLKKALAMPGGMKAMIGYYRAMIRSSSREERKVMSQQTSVPTLFFAGEEDGSVGLDQFLGIENAFTSDFEFVSYAGVGHFPHREKFQEFSTKVLAFIGSAV
jgi:pimeloyl-ACP methyl ester carboxylesterase